MTSDTNYLEEHRLLDDYLETPTENDLPARSAKMDKPSQLRLLTAAVERVRTHKEAHQPPPEALVELIGKLAKRKNQYTDRELHQLLECSTVIIEPADRSDVAWEELNIPIPGVVASLTAELERLNGEQPLSNVLREATRRVIDALKPMEFWAGFKKTIGRLELLLASEEAVTELEGDAWATVLRADVDKMKGKQRVAWRALLACVPKGNAAKPGAKWKKETKGLLEAVGHAAFAKRAEEWLGLVGSQVSERIKPGNASLLRGLVWHCSTLSDETACRALANVAEGGLKKLPGGGLYASSIAKAAITSLENMEGTAPLAQLARLKHRIISPWGQEEIAAAMNRAVERTGIPCSEIEEISLPTFGLNSGGVGDFPVGPYTVQLRITGTQAIEKTWVDEAGHKRKTEPAAAKKHPDQRKALRRLESDIKKMLIAQRERLEALCRDDREWSLPTWRTRYLNHPLLTGLCQKLIWQLTLGKRSSAGMFHQGGFVDATGAPLDWITDDTNIKIWHPLGVEPKRVLAWREWLETQQIAQPFKQAHREIYIVTDAEQATESYSNRFAAHVVKQHQFKALCDTRHWRCDYKGQWDADETGATLELPNWNLRAEFWTDHSGSEYADSGVALHVTTDQVRFTSPTGEAIPVAQVPAKAFSEVMRDIDLFVGVSSIGRDPTWADGGPERYREYWEAFAFGPLQETATTRKDVLKRLLPRLKIKKQCVLSDRHLEVSGKLRTYRIHIGSGNILMNPNDRYLCIVPDRKTPKAVSTIFLPFEGDQLLTEILSKAFLLAADDKIKDSEILRQLET